MYWNYRVVRAYHPNEGLSTFGIHEVYYDEVCQVEWWSADPMEPFGNSLAELRNHATHMLEAFSLPVLREAHVNGQLTLVEDDDDGLPIIEAS